MCNYNGFNPDIAMKLYKSMTCKLVGENKQKVRIAEVRFAAVRIIVA